MAEQLDRFRSFAERYVIERASTFTKGNEVQEGWQAAVDARKLYQIIANVKDTEIPNLGEASMPDPPGAQVTVANGAAQGLVYNKFSRPPPLGPWFTKWRGK